MSALLGGRHASDYRETCVVPGCGKQADLRYSAKPAAGHYCTKHGQEVFKHDEPKKVVPWQELMR